MKKKSLTAEQQAILAQVEHIASALGTTLARFTEVVGWSCMTCVRRSMRSWRCRGDGT
jgi:hypothetical protein